MPLRASAPFSSRINAGTGGDRFLVPDCALKAISPAAPLQFLPLLAPGVVFGVVKDTIFAIRLMMSAVFQFAKYTINGR